MNIKDQILKNYLINKYMDKYEVLKKLHEIQANNIGIIDCSIEVRKDHRCTGIIFRACNYGQLADLTVNPENKSKLYIHTFKWVEPDCEKEFNKIHDEIKMLTEKY